MYRGFHKSLPQHVFLKRSNEHWEPIKCICTEGTHRIENNPKEKPFFKGKVQNTELFFNKSNSMSPMINIFSQTQVHNFLIFPLTLTKQLDYVEGSQCRHMILYQQMNVKNAAGIQLFGIH